jgi:hypothetical protein
MLSLRQLLLSWPFRISHDLPLFHTADAPSSIKSRVPGRRLFRRTVVCEFMAADSVAGGMGILVEVVENDRRDRKRVDGVSGLADWVRLSFFDMRRTPRAASKRGQGTTPSWGLRSSRGRRGGKLSATETRNDCRAEKPFLPSNPPRQRLAGLCGGRGGSRRQTTSVANPHPDSVASPPTEFVAPNRVSSAPMVESRQSKIFGPPPRIPPSP